MQEVDDLPQGFLGFILPGDILKGLACLRLDINLCVGFAEGHGIAADAAHFAHCLLHYKLPEQEEYDKHNQAAQPRRNLLGLDLPEGCARFVKPLDQRGVVHAHGVVDLMLLRCDGRIAGGRLFVLEEEVDHILLDLRLGDVLFVHFVQEDIVADLLHGAFRHDGQEEHIDDAHEKQCHQPIIQ